MIIHIDMDAFFASVEIRERPELAGLPVIVGGTAEGRGVVAAASYAARKYGVKSAMPVATALKLCPQLICLRHNMALYVEVSRQIREIFARYTPVIEPLSLDEAFLDVSGSKRLFGSAEDIGQQIKAAIREELQLTASVGVAPNKFLAKIASDIKKPDGFVVVDAERVQAFLDPLPIERIWGVGKQTANALHHYGIRTIQQLRQQSPKWLEDRFGKLGVHIWQLAHGQDQRKVIAESQAKSISAETTFAEDLDNSEILSAWLLQLTEQVTARLRQQQLKARTVFIKLRHQDFTTLTRSYSLQAASQDTEVVWSVVKQLFNTEFVKNKKPMRLVGVGVSNFKEDEQQQADMFLQQGKSRELDQLTDAINTRFGTKGIHRGTTFKKQNKPH